MTATSIAQEAGQPELAEQVAQAAIIERRQRLVRQLVITAALLAVFVGGSALLIMFFQPFVDGAGGCGGG